MILSISFSMFFSYVYLYYVIYLYTFLASSSSVSLCLFIKCHPLTIHLLSIMFSVCTIKNIETIIIEYNQEMFNDNLSKNKRLSMDEGGGKQRVVYY